MSPTTNQSQPWKKKVNYVIEFVTLKMKILFMIFGILLVALTVQGRPACEECDDEVPLAVPDENVLKVVKIQQMKQDDSNVQEVSSISPRIIVKITRGIFLTF